MNKIISVAFVIFQSAFLACCNGCNQSPAPSYHEAPVREAPKEVLVDTVSELRDQLLLHMVLRRLIGKERKSLIICVALILPLRMIWMITA